MADKPGMTLSAVEAARRIYNSPAPTAEQVGRVVEKIESGALPRSARGGLTTTLEAVAEYLARREAARQPGGRGAGGRGGSGQAAPSSPTARRAAGASNASFSHAYRELLKDYFLAVLLRRKISDRSRSFHRAVAASQAVLLAAILGLATILSIGAIRARMLPPDHRTIHTWAAGRHEDPQIAKISPLPEQPGAYRVEFSYRAPGHKRIQSVVFLTLQQGQVVSVASGY